MKVNKMNLAALRNEEHFQLMVDVKSLVETTKAQILNISQLFPIFTGFFNKEDIALEALRKSALIEPIVDADYQRDSIYRGFVSLIETYNCSSDPNKVQASRNIQHFINHYEDFRLKSYSEETTVIYNFLQDIKDRCANDIRTLNARDWIRDLDSANQIFSSLMNQRFDKNAGQKIDNMREIRRSIDKIYTQIIDNINASILSNEETAYADFVCKLNERIDYFNNMIARRKSKLVTKKEIKMMENLLDLKSEILLRTQVYYGCFFSKMITVSINLFFVYSPIGLYEIISEDTLLASLFCIFIQIITIIFDFFLGKQIKKVRKILKYSGEERKDFPLKSGNSIVHILFTTLICILTVCITCFWGKIIDENDTGFISFLILVSLIIIACSVYFFYHPMGETEEEIEKSTQRK